MKYADGAFNAPFNPLSKASFAYLIASIITHTSSFVSMFRDIAEHRSFQTDVGYFLRV